MTIHIPAKQEQWLRDQVSRGVFASVDEAVEQLISIEMALEGDDLAWAKDTVEAARRSAHAGEVVDLNDAMQDIDACMAELRAGSPSS